MKDTATLAGSAFTYHPRTLGCHSVRDLHVLKGQLGRSWEGLVLAALVALVALVAWAMEPTKFHFSNSVPLHHRAAVGYLGDTNLLC